MDNRKKAVRNAKTGADPDLNFGYGDLLGELTKELAFEEKEPGDITVEDLMETTGMTRSWINEMLARKVRSGELIRLKVRGSRKSGWIYAYRRAT